MHRKIRTAICCCAALVLLLPATAATYVEFRDGRYLEVRDHDVRGDWIRLELEPGASMIIPADSVDVIESNRLVVYRQQHPRTAIALMRAMTGPRVESVAMTRPPSERPAPAPGTGAPSRSLGN